MGQEGSLSIISQLFWLAVTFSILIVFINKITIPKFVKLLEARRSKILLLTKSAEIAKEEATRIENECLIRFNHTKKLSNLKLIETQKTLVEKSKKKIEEAEKKFSLIVTNAEKNMMLTQIEISKNMHPVVVEVVKCAAESFANISVSDEKVELLVKKIGKS